MSQSSLDHCRGAAAVAAVFFINTIICTAQILGAPFYDKTPYHTSALTGHAWVTGADQWSF